MLQRTSNTVYVQGRESKPIQFPILIVTFFFLNWIHICSEFAFAVDKCAKCDSHARCDNGNCVCMEGWVGDGQTCTPEDGGSKLPSA